MRTRSAILLLAIASLILSNFIGCSNTATIDVEESISITDSQQASQLPAISVAETISITDSTRTSLSALISILETINVADLPQSFLSAVIGLTEAINVIDTVQVSSAILVNVTETIYVSDLPTIISQVIECTVTVTSPKAGEVWPAGSTKTIRWTTTGQDIAYVDIYYSTDAGFSMIDIARFEPDDGSYTWVVPFASSQTVLVRVLAFNGQGQTLALGDSGLFTITPQ
jgi:hypothetical protein